ncbi:MAG: transcriptional regulator [Spirochaetaceae bacterium]|nr:MAG: transcriptional regulator [Spirochaetaceae bacterium]
MNEAQKKAVRERLSRIEGQVRGIQKMVEEDRYCMDILAQTRSVVAALRATEDRIMENHLQTCVVDAIRSDDASDQKQKLDEVMSVLTQFRKHG